MLYIFSFNSGKFLSFCLWNWGPVTEWTCSMLFHNSVSYLKILNLMLYIVWVGWYIYAYINFSLVLYGEAPLPMLCIVGLVQLNVHCVTVSKKPFHLEPVYNSDDTNFPTCSTKSSSFAFLLWTHKQLS